MNTETKTPQQIAQAMYDELFPRAADIVATGQEHAPMLLAFGPAIGKAMWPLHKFDKDTIAHLHIKTALHRDVESCALIMECWMAKGDTQDQAEAAVLRAAVEGQISVSDIPNKAEAILFNIRVGTAQFLGMCEIDRAAGKLAKGDLLDLSNRESGEQYEGRFVGDGDQQAQRARRMAN